MGYNFYRSVFWGIVLILIGVSVVVNQYFNLSIPIITVIIAIILIAAGIRIILGGSFGGWHGSHDWDGFGYQVFKYEPGSGDKEYDLKFKGATIDLSEASLDKGNVKIDIKGSFGGGVVILNPDIPTRIEAEISFGGVTFPDGAAVGFGRGSYESPGFKADSPHLFIKVDASFGGLRFTTHKEGYYDWHSMKREWKDERRRWRHHGHYHH